MCSFIRLSEIDMAYYAKTDKEALEKTVRRLKRCITELIDPRLSESRADADYDFLVDLRGSLNHLKEDVQNHIENRN